MILILIITGFLAGVALGLAKQSDFVTWSDVQFWLFAILGVAATAAGTLIGIYLLFDLMATVAPFTALSIVIASFFAGFAFGACAVLLPHKT